MRTILFGTRYCVILTLAMLLTQIGYAQSVSNDDGTRAISAARLRGLLRQPGGIQKATDILGNFSFSEPAERWGEHNLPSLNHSSSFIFRGILTKSDAMLSTDGDSVDTVYTFEVSESLKGESSGKVTVRCKGGKFVFPNGHTVTMHTPTSDNLQVGTQYIVFLANQDDYLTLVGGIEGVFEVSADSQTAHLIDRDSSRDRDLRYLDGARLSTIEQEVRNTLG